MNFSVTDSVKVKLNPGRFMGISGKMAAIIGCVLGEKYTEPAIAEIVVTSDGMVLARNEGDFGCNDVIGDALDLKNNWYRLLSVAGLSKKENLFAQLAFAERIRRF